MNLPKGPDSLCFDKDVFMKVKTNVNVTFGSALTIAYAVELASIS